MAEEENTKEGMEAAEAQPRRLASIDALRGFDMFFITGGSALISGLCIAFESPKCWLATQMNHVAWTGFAHHDTIFPLFLFIAGMTFPFSLANKREKGIPEKKIDNPCICAKIQAISYRL